MSEFKIDKSLIEKLNIQISQDQRIWLEEIWKTVKENALQPNYKTIRIKVHGHISNDFDPSEIDYRLASEKGLEIKLLGILYIGKEIGPVLNVGEALINWIKKKLFENEENKLNIILKEVAEELDLDEKMVRISLTLLSEYGNLWNSASKNRDGQYGYDNLQIDLNEQRILNFYLGFTNITETINRYHTQLVAWQEQDLFKKQKENKPTRVRKAFGKRNGSEDVFQDLFAGTRAYLERTAREASHCSDHGLFTASLILVRKLLEGLVIELYEKHSRESEIKDVNGNYFQFSRLIDSILRDDSGFNLSRNSKSYLPEIKQLADICAHNRKFTARETDFEKVFLKIRVVLQELIALSFESSSN